MPRPIRIYFELEEGADAEKVKSSLEEELARIDEVGESEVKEPGERITGLEIAAAIGVGIVVAKSAGEAIDATAAVLESLAKLVRSIKGLKSAIVETPSGPKRIEEISAGDVEVLSR